MDETQVIVCDTCGCPVHPTMLQTHSDWHDTLVTRTSDEESKSVANQDRTRL